MTLLNLIKDCGVHPAIGDEGAGYGIEQNPDELAQFLDAMYALEVKSILEIGTGPNSGLARFLAENLSWDVTSVDIHVPYYRSPFIGLIISPDRVTFDRTFDVVLIDADHSYESVKADHLHYAQYADKVVAFHDIVGLRDCEGAAKYWKEITYAKNKKRRKGYYEAIADGDNRIGIGWYLK